MKKSIAIIIAVCLCASYTFSQSKKVGWFITPEIGGMVLEDHIGLTSGASLGVKVWKNRLKLGIHVYGRPGPINSKTYTVQAANGQSYKGSSTLTLRADQAAFGLLIAPTFSINRWNIDIPINVGSMGAGFYLAGEDRVTPDGDRVSVWEDKLMDGKDAAFGNWFEFGVRGFAPLKNESIQVGLGLHYTIIQGWSTYYDPSGQFYNNKFRFSLFFNFTSKE